MKFKFMHHRYWIGSASLQNLWKRSAILFRGAHKNKNSNNVMLAKTKSNFKLWVAIIVQIIVVSVLHSFANTIAHHRRRQRSSRYHVTSINSCGASVSAVSLFFLFRAFAWDCYCETCSEWCWTPFNGQVYVDCWKLASSPVTCMNIKLVNQWWQSVRHK